MHDIIKAHDEQVQCGSCGQADWERSRKELDKAKHDVERLRRALDRSDVEKRDQQQKGLATRQALQVYCKGHPCIYPSVHSCIQPSVHPSIHPSIRL